MTAAHIPDSLIATGLISGAIFYLASTWLTWRAGIRHGINIGRAESDRKYRPRADILALEQAQRKTQLEKAFREAHQAPSKLPMEASLDKWVQESGRPVSVAYVPQEAIDGLQAASSRMEKAAETIRGLARKQPATTVLTCRDDGEPRMTGSTITREVSK